MTHRISAALSVVFMALAAVALVAGRPAVAAEPGQCPQPRFTGKAPDDYLSRKNPVAGNEGSVKAGESIFLGEGRIASCFVCHGREGDGKGQLASQFDPPPRNFRCAETINGVPDGQLFWIIKFGSPGAAMPPHPRLSDEQIWQVITYLRQLAK